MKSLQTDRWTTGDQKSSLELPGEIKLKSTDLVNALPKYTKYIEHITFINYYINLEAFNGKYNQ